MVIAETLTDDQINRAKKQAAAIGDSAQESVKSDQFVFVAAFDGTNNDRKDIALSGNPQSTNVAQLFEQVDRATRPDSNQTARYYPGPGTKDSLTASSWFGPEVTEQVIKTANNAYDDFARAAVEWLKVHPGGNVTTMITSFSRGGASAAIFSQLLWERGLVDPDTKKVLVPPGQVGVSAGLIYDPVDTGVSGNLAFAPNVKNITVVHSENEYRAMFRGADYRGQPGITTLDFTGNHCDIGGGYDNGLGALSLQAGTDFFRNTGLSVEGVALARQFDSSKPVVIHDEGTNDHGKEIWTEYGSVEYGSTRLWERVVTPAREQTLKDGRKAMVFTDVNGNKTELSTGAEENHTEAMHATSGGAAVSARGADNGSREGHDTDGFSIYGMDGNGNVHPSMTKNGGDSTTGYTEQWLAEHGYQQPAQFRPKNAG